LAGRGLLIAKAAESDKPEIATFSTLATYSIVTLGLDPRALYLLATRQV
jgi:hypothetical protein